MTNRIDPKTDPARRCLKNGAWPEADRRAWQAALQNGDIFDAAGMAAEWKPGTQHKVATAYGRWLTSLDRAGLLDPDLTPAQRVTRENLARYIGDLEQAGNAPYTVLGRVRDISNAMKAMAPEHDWGWLYRVIRRLRRNAVSLRDKHKLVVPSGELYAYGLELMAGAEGPSAGSPLARAATYRNGLMIALLAARPLRRANFASIEVGRHLIKQGEQYVLRFRRPETKTDVPIEDAVPTALVPNLERYLSHHRPILIRRTGRWRNRLPDLAEPGAFLWISRYCSPMSEGAIYDQITKLTRVKFGHELSPHLFRDSAATTIATEDPAHVYITKSILGHSSIQTSERHYNHARSLEASRRYQDRMLELRRHGRDRKNSPEPKLEI
jgi:integrase/recombinase XerD